MGSHRTKDTERRCEDCEEYYSNYDNYSEHRQVAVLTMALDPSSCLCGSSLLGY